MLRAFFAMFFLMLYKSVLHLPSTLAAAKPALLKMRRHVVTQAARRISAVAGHRLPQCGDLANQQIDLLLLANHNRVELFEQVFGKAGLDLQRVEALLNTLQCMRRFIEWRLSDVFWGGVVFHAPIGPELPGLAAKRC